MHHNPGWQICVPNVWFEPTQYVTTIQWGTFIVKSVIIYNEIEHIVVMYISMPWSVPAIPSILPGGNYSQLYSPCQITTMHLKILYAGAQCANEFGRQTCRPTLSISTGKGYGSHVVHAWWFKTELEIIFDKSFTGHCIHRKEMLHFDEIFVTGCMTEFLTSTTSGTVQPATKISRKRHPFQWYMDL